MTARVVLLGRGIGYSASPAMHNGAFAALGLDWRYELLDLPIAALRKAVADLRAGRLAGANVTQPHKSAMTPLLDEIEPAAGQIGAVNTVVRRGERLVGTNTDIPALAEELRTLGEFHRAVILGRGGGARAAQAVLAASGTLVDMVGRDRWAEVPALLAAADLLVNATPVGTAADVSPLPAALMRPGLAVFDLVYRPSPSRLVCEARAAGAIARGGAGMLLRQAALSFALWTDVAAPVEVMRDALRAELGPGIDA